jgi:hypothetical protein
MQQVYSTQKTTSKAKNILSKLNIEISEKENVKVLRVCSNIDSTMIDSDDKNLFFTNLVLKRELNIQTKISIFENCKSERLKNLELLHPIF